MSETLSTSPKPWALFQDERVWEDLHRWWLTLADDRGSRAKLRRCETPNEVIYVPAYHRLRHDIEQHQAVAWPRNLAAVAGLASHLVEHDGRQSLAAQMAQRRDGSDRAVLSGLRFRRLLACDDIGDLYPALRRVVRLLGGTVNLRSLAADTYAWNETVRRSWAFDYYDHAPSEA